MKRQALASILGILGTVTTSSAWAQNADPFFFGDEAALGSGAVVASGRDSGALWYNPAGFGDLKRGLVSASASTFGLRIRNVPNALRVGGQPGGAALSSSDIISVPNAIVAAAKIGDRSALAAGLLITSRDVRSALVSVPEGPATDADGPFLLGQRLDKQLDRSKYHLGAAFASAFPGMRLGAAAFVTYQKATDSVQYAISARRGPNPTDEHAFITASARVTSSAIGIAGSLGAQWELSPPVTLGLTIRTPELALSASSEGGGVVAGASAGGTAPAQAGITETVAPQPSLAGTVIAPTRVFLGVAFALGPPASWLEIGADAAHGLPASAILPAQQPTVNARVGVRYMLSPSWIVGGGLFSDRATVANLQTFIASDRVDYYGFTVGVSKRTPLALVKDPAPEALVLVTTLSLRSSIGFGEARAVTIDVGDSSPPRDDRSDVTFYEVMPYLGSAVVF